MDRVREQGKAWYEIRAWGLDESVSNGDGVKWIHLSHKGQSDGLIIRARKGGT